MIDIAPFSSDHSLRLVLIRHGEPEQAANGKCPAKIEQLFPREYKLWMDHPTIVTFPGGESFAEMKKRVLEFKDFLLKTNAGKTVLVVSHGGTNRMLLAEALGITDEMVFRLDQGYAAMNIIDYFSSHTVVRLMNG